MIFVTVFFFVHTVKVNLSRVAFILLGGSFGNSLTNFKFLGNQSVQVSEIRFLYVTLTTWVSRVRTRSLLTWDSAISALSSASSRSCWIFLNRVILQLACSSCHTTTRDSAMKSVRCILFDRSHDDMWQYQWYIFPYTILNLLCTERLNYWVDIASEWKIRTASSACLLKLFTFACSLSIRSCILRRVFLSSSVCAENTKSFRCTGNETRCFSVASHVFLWVIPGKWAL